MKLSRTVSYGVQATLQLADAGKSGPVPCSRLAAEGHMPERFLLQILRNLVRHGILHSTRGVDGGYQLEKKLEEISLLEIIEALDGPLAPELPNTEGLTEPLHNRLQAALQEVTEISRRQLETVKLSQLSIPRPPASVEPRVQDNP